MSEHRLPIHPYAELFPPMNLAEFERLCDDIQQHGLQEDIVLLEGEVLDGRSRYLACLARGKTPRFRPYAGECGSPLAFVVSRNLHRRHLTESQRAMVAARLKPLFEEEARQRMLATLKHGNDLPAVQNSAQREKHEENGKSVQKAAELMNVSRFSVQAADWFRSRVSRRCPRPWQPAKSPSRWQPALPRCRSNSSRLKIGNPGGQDAQPPQQDAQPPRRA